MELDYTTKIKNFQARIDNYNEEVALEYLMRADWDESVTYFLLLASI